MNTNLLFKEDNVLPARKHTVITTVTHTQVQDEEGYVLVAGSTPEVVANKVRSRLALIVRRAEELREELERLESSHDLWQGTLLDLTTEAK